jgi:hypothetical protein
VETVVCGKQVEVNLDSLRAANQRPPKGRRQWTLWMFVYLTRLCSTAWTGFCGTIQLREVERRLLHSWAVKRSKMRARKVFVLSF